MKISEIKEFSARNAQRIAQGDLTDALAHLRAFSEQIMAWETTDRIDALARTYSYMLRYFASSATDPGRTALLADIKAQARAITDSLTRRALMAENPTLYFNTARTLAVRRDESVATLIGRYIAEERRLDSDYNSLADPNRRATAEALMRDIFARVWVTYPFTQPDADALIPLLTSPGKHVPAAALAVSALALGLMEYYDAARMQLLLRVYITSESAEIALRALVGFLMAAFRYRRRPMPQSVLDTLAAAKDTPAWQSDLRAAAIEVLRSRDTERISRKLRQDIYPTLLKMQGELKDKIGQGDLDLNELAQGENPEWDELLNRDGLGDKLKEISEIQADGGDVFMATFANLKQFPFFGDVANWFMPYHESHTAVATLDGLDGSLGLLLSRLPMLCDSDKFSITLSMNSLPEAQRRTALQALGAQADQMSEMLSEVTKADPAEARRAIINKNIQALYRFHKLFRRKNEFFNPFDNQVNFLDLPAVAHDFNDPATLDIIAQFSFRHKLWAEAAGLLQRVDDLSEPDAARYQKLGYCYESLGDNARALGYYEQAELLDDASRWTLRRMAAVLRREHNAARAVTCYRRLAAMLPDDFTVTLNLACALTEAGDTEQAEQQFHKGAYLDPESVQARRGLAWTQLINGKPDDAAESYRFVISREATRSDYLNAGHTARARHDNAEAINYYRLWLESEEPARSPDELMKAFETDGPWLAKAGIDTDENRLFIEFIKSQQKW